MRPGIDENLKLSNTETNFFEKPGMSCCTPAASCMEKKGPNMLQL
ncbi:hypothetical protein MmTuc01_3246 [Methanosarcina mazei Tuc01]|uniref:Uncharacterized protein n=1 Tax=Methanosarcina mazei Tuc01 TaxID=1236903 RepID=M1QE47_METMZ|nr:hypothetical protein MmTuc01_3246 [Methanosarcina mazei Tuc01]